MAKHPTAKTSVPQIPAAYTDPNLKHVYRGSRNLDYGGGRFEKATEYLMTGLNCENLVYDPHCRTPAHNIDVIRNLDFDGGIKVISCLNVLNVLLDKEDRDQVIEAVKYLANSYPSVKHVVFQVYTVDSSGVSTKSQLNKKPSWYFEDLRKEFQDWDFDLYGGSKKNIIHFWRD